MRKAAVSESRIDLPNIDTALFQQPDAQRLMAPERATHAPRFLLLYGPLRDRSFSRLAAEEAAHILSALGGGTRMFNPRAEERRVGNGGVSQCSTRGAPEPYKKNDYNHPRQ